MLVSASPAGPDGRHSLGVAVGSVIDAVRSAPLVIGQVNPSMPYVRGVGELPPDAFDYLVEIESPLPELTRAPPGPVEEAIAEHVVGLVPDEATLAVRHRRDPRGGDGAPRPPVATWACTRA